MKLTADEFVSKRQEAFRAADKGEKVEIEHNRYPDRVFNLTAENRELNDGEGED